MTCLVCWVGHVYIAQLVIFLKFMNINLSQRETIFCVPFLSSLQCIKIYLKESTSHHIIDVIRTVYRVQNANFNIDSHVHQIIYPEKAEIASFGYL